jgi:hypothetical protein
MNRDKESKQVKSKYHTKRHTRRHAGRKIAMDAMRTFESAKCIYGLAPGEDGRWYLICNMVDPPTWIMSWPSLPVARRFMDQMSGEDAQRMKHLIVDVVEKTGEIIACDLGEANTMPGFIRDLNRVAAEALARGRPLSRASPATQAKQK